MIKFLIIVLIIIIFTYFGYLLSQKNKNKYLFFDGFYSFNLTLINNISFQKENFLSFLEKENNNNLFIKEIKKQLQKNEEEITFLDKEEFEFFKNYVKNIGTSDSFSQLNYLKIKEKELYEKKEKCSLEYEKYKNFYLKIFFLIGLIISIVIL